MRLKTKLLAGASTLALAGGVMLTVAPVAHATPTAVGSCQDSISLLKIKPALTDQTQVGVKIAGNLAKDQTTKLVVNNGGTCTGIMRPGDTHVPQPTGPYEPEVAGDCAPRQHGLRQRCDRAGG